MAEKVKVTVDVDTRKAKKQTSDAEKDAKDKLGKIQQGIDKTKGEVAELSKSASAAQSKAGKGFKSAKVAGRSVAGTVGRAVGGATVALAAAGLAAEVAAQVAGIIAETDPGGIVGKIAAKVEKEIAGGIDSFGAIRAGVGVAADAAIAFKRAGVELSGGQIASVALLVKAQMQSEMLQQRRVTAKKRALALDYLKELGGG